MFNPFGYSQPMQSYGYGVTNPETAMRWQVADAAPQGTRAFRQGQAGLEKWIDGQIANATASGQLNVNNPMALDSYLSTLGVTNEKGGGRYLYNKYKSGGAARAAVANRYGGNMTLGGLGGYDPFGGW